MNPADAGAYTVAMNLSTNIPAGASDATTHPGSWEISVVFVVLAIFCAFVAFVVKTGNRM